MDIQGQVAERNAVIRFSLHEKIGEDGGEGSVFRAHDPQLDAEIAVKVVPLANFSNFDQLFNESQMLYKSRHHNVVVANYACVDSSNRYISMPLYKNGSLAARIRGGFLTCREIIRYSLQFLSGLNNIHSKGLVHFDIKPENILISDADQALVSDFGLARYTSSLGFAKVDGTTRPYAPPEFFTQSTGMLHNKKFDIYQAGLTLYRMCYRQINFERQLQQYCDARGAWDNSRLEDDIQNGRFPDRDFFLPHIPIPLRKIVRTALSTDPDERYPTVIHFLNSLSEITSVNDFVYRSESGDNEVWTGGNICIRASKSGDDWSLSVTKGTKQVRKYCQSSLTEGKKRSLVYNCISENLS